MCACLGVTNECNLETETPLVKKGSNFTNRTMKGNLGVISSDTKGKRGSNFTSITVKIYNYCIVAIKQVSSETETSRGKRGGKCIYKYYCSFYNYCYCIVAPKQVSSETETSRGKRGGKCIYKYYCSFYNYCYCIVATKQVSSGQKHQEEREKVSIYM